MRRASTSSDQQVEGKGRGPRGVAVRHHFARPRHHVKANALPASSHDPQAFSAKSCLSSTGDHRLDQGDVRPRVAAVVSLLVPACHRWRVGLGARCVYGNALVGASRRLQREAFWAVEFCLSPLTSHL